MVKKDIISGIYKITNNVNGKCYIGQSIDIEKRFSQHKSGNYRKLHINKRLYKAFEKYGINNFSFDIIDKCEINSLDDREIYWIEHYDSYANGYNDTKGGKGAKGFNHCCIRITDKNKMIELLCNQCNINCNNEIAFDCPYDETIEDKTAMELEDDYDGYITMTEDFCDGYRDFESWAECNLI